MQKYELCLGCNVTGMGFAKICEQPYPAHHVQEVGTLLSSHIFQGAPSMHAMLERDLLVGPDEVATWCGKVS